MPNFIDLTGDKFGRLTVLERAANQGQKTAWLCQCDCGNQMIVRSTHLRSGHTTSCGCRSKEVSRDRYFKDITNQKFGKLTALKYIGDEKWLCICDCGTEILIRGVDLRRGHTQSCGCNKSRGETKISSLLNENSIIFQKQVTIPSCRFTDTKALAKFDFGIFNEQGKLLFLIEYDGIQHFTCTGYGWDNEVDFVKRQEHDQFKTNWCKENNIPLIRIDYIHLDTLTIKDLLLETTKHRVV